MMKHTSIREIIAEAVKERVQTEVLFYIDGLTHASSGFIERREIYQPGYYLNNAQLPLKRIVNPRRIDGILRLEVK